MNPARHTLSVLALAVLAQTAAAQTTNFTPRAPRSYNAVVKLHSIQPLEAGPEREELEHYFAPDQDAGFKAAPQGGEASPRTANPAAARLKRKRDDGDTAGRPPPTLSELAAGNGSARDASVRQGSVVDEIMKQRAITRTVAANNRAAVEREAADAEATGSNPEARGGSKQDSIWRTAEEAAAVLSAQRRQDYSASLLNMGKPAGEPYSDSQRTLHSGQAQPYASGLSPQQRSAQPFAAGSPTIFGSTPFQLNTPSIFAPGGGLQQPDNPLPRPPSAFGGSPGASFDADLKKPATLPW